MTKFIDGFGHRRMFCKNCYGSFLENRFIGNPEDQMSLKNFKLGIYSNPRAVIRPR